LLRAIVDPQFGVALKSMHEKVDALWTVETLAAACGMSRSALHCVSRNWSFSAPIGLPTFAAKGLKKLGMRLGNWLRAEQGRALLQAPGVWHDIDGRKGIDLFVLLFRVSRDEAGGAASRFTAIL
jgi:AraC-like DNA-binding protein